MKLLMSHLVVSMPYVHGVHGSDPAEDKPQDCAKCINTFTASRVAEDRRVLLEAPVGSGKTIVTRVLVLAIVNHSDPHGLPIRVPRTC